MDTLKIPEWTLPDRTVQWNEAFDPPDSPQANIWLCHLFRDHPVGGSMDYSMSLNEEQKSLQVIVVKDQTMKEGRRTVHSTDETMIVIGWGDKVQQLVKACRVTQQPC